jgi:hypothetical protein
MESKDNAKNKNKTYYIITYRDPKDGKVVECKARKIQDSGLGLSFVSISDFVFNNSSVVVDPTEEYLRKRLENVKSLHLSVYSIVSVEEVGTENSGLKFRNDKSNLVVLNTSAPSPDKPPH